MHLAVLPSEPLVAMPAAKGVVGHEQARGNQGEAATDPQGVRRAPQRLRQDPAVGTRGRADLALQARPVPDMLTLLQQRAGASLRCPRALPRVRCCGTDSSER